MRVTIAQLLCSATATVPAGHHRLVFGAPISSSGQIVLLQILAHVETFASYEGIFRKSGSKQRMDQLVNDLREKDFQQILLSEMYTPHDYASVLKQYFSELPEPLLLKRHLDAYKQTAGEYHNCSFTFNKACACFTQHEITC